MSSDRSFRPSTLAIHAGAPRDLHASSILFPIHQTTAYVQEAVGVHKGHSYSRTSNPTVDALEQTIAALEGTPATLCFRSGMAAITTLCLSLLKSVTMPLFRRLFTVERSVCSDKCWVTSAATEVGKARAGDLRIGASESSRLYLLPKVLVAFSEQFPDTKIEIVCQHQDALLTRLKHRRLDIALLSISPDDPELETRLIVRDELVLIANPTHRLSN